MTDTTHASAPASAAMGAAARPSAAIRELLGGISVSPEQADLLEQSRRFLSEQWPADAVRPQMEEAASCPPALWERMGELGWHAAALPETHGGLGLALTDLVPVAEEMGAHLLASPWTATQLAARALQSGGGEALQEIWLPRLAAGAPVSLAPQAVAGTELRAAPDGGGVALSGTATLVADAAGAEALLVRANGPDGPLLAWLDGPLEPARLRRETVIDETQRAYEVSLDGLAVPDAHLLADPNAALAELELAQALLVAAQMVGGARAVIDETAEYLKTRTQFGKKIGAFQSLKHALVDAFVGYETARSHLYGAAHSFGRQGEGEIAVRMARAAAEDAFNYAADRAIQFHGGFGFTHDCNAGLFRRRAIWLAAQGGNARQQRRRLADLLLGPA